MGPDAANEAQVARQYRRRSRTEVRRPPVFAPFEEALSTSCAQDANSTECDIAIDDGSIEAFRLRLRSGEATVKGTVLACLARVRRSEAAQMCAVTELDPDVLAVAAAMDEVVGVDERRYPLWGIPIAVKDNIATRRQLHTTAGAAAMRDARAYRDAPVVAALRNAGAIILAKANLSEWAFFMARDGAAGYSALGGQTRNPYGRFDVGGSSSGSAVAVALGLVFGAVGTETCGSIANPSSQNGVVGFKPAVGAVSSRGVIPVAPAFDVVGPMARTVDGAAALYAALSGRPVTGGGRRLQEALPRIGVVVGARYLSTMRERDRRFLQELRRQLSDIGFVVTEVEIDEAAWMVDVDKLLTCTFRDSVNRALQELNGGPRSLREVIDHNLRDCSAYAPFGQELLVEADTSILPPDECHARTAGAILLCRRAIDDALDRARCDVLVSVNEYLSPLYATAGYPAITVPAAILDDGEPIGMTATAPPGSEPVLFSAAFVFEKAIGIAPLRPPILRGSHPLP